MHFAAEFSRNGDLPSLCDRCFHMTSRDQRILFRRERPGLMRCSRSGSAFQRPNFPCPSPFPPILGGSPPFKAASMLTSLVIPVLNGRAHSPVRNGAKLSELRFDGQRPDRSQPGAQRATSGALGNPPETGQALKGRNNRRDKACKAGVVWRNHREEA